MNLNYIIEINWMKTCIYMILLFLNSSNFSQNIHQDELTNQKSNLKEIVTKLNEVINKVAGKGYELQSTTGTGDANFIIKDYCVWMDEILIGSNESFITEAGDIERWVGTGKKKLLENKEETIKYLQSLKK